MVFSPHPRPALLSLIGALLDLETLIKQLGERVQLLASQEAQAEAHLNCLRGGKAEIEFLIESLRALPAAEIVASMGVEPAVAAPLN